MPRRFLLHFVITFSVIVGLAGCGDSSGTDGSGGVGTGEFLVANRVRTPDSRTTFASILPELDVGQVDLGGAREFSGVSRARAYGGKVFVFDGESGVVTRFVVEGDELIEDVLADGSRARFSMMREGVTSFTSQIIFLSDERAYYVDTLAFDQVVVWNPTTMAVTSTFPAPQLAREGFSSTTGGTLVALDDVVAMPISWADFVDTTFAPVAAMIVFSATEDRVIGLIEDDRCVISRSAFVDDESIFLMADTGGGVADLFVEPGSLPPPCLLRWSPGDTAFDPDFYRDLRAIADVPFVSGAVARGDGTFVTQLYTSTIDPSTLDPQELIDLSLWQWGIIDWRNDTSTLIEEIPLGGVSREGWVIDDRYLIPQFDDEGAFSVLFDVDESGATELLSIAGEFQSVERIR